MNRACLTLFKLKGYIDCLQFLDLNPKLLVSANPVFVRSQSPELPQTNGLVVPPEFQFDDGLEITLNGLDIVYEFEFGIIDLKYKNKYFSIPIEYTVSVNSHDDSYSLLAHDSPVRFINVRSTKLKLVK